MRPIPKVVPTITLLVMLATFLGACELATRPDRRMVGVLEWDGISAGRNAGDGAVFSRGAGGSQAAISAPDSVTAGVPFMAVAHTFGPTTCWKSAGTEVNQAAQLAIIVPYDMDPRSAGDACGDMVIVIDHPVEITFPQPGDATIRVRGRRIVGQDFEQPGESIEVEKRIVVR